MDEPKRYNPANTLTPADMLPTMRVRFLATDHEGLINARDFNPEEHESLEPKAKGKSRAPAAAVISTDEDDEQNEGGRTRYDVKVERPKLEAMTKDALIALAEEKGVELQPKANKTEIVDELVDAKVAV